MGLDMYLKNEREQEVGYWRKANQVHNWFVENVQDGVDDCGQYKVTYEQLQKLKNLCLRVLETENHRLLPPCAGFFFGSTDIDDYYYEDLRNTVEIISSLDPKLEYIYQSSW